MNVPIYGGSDLEIEMSFSYTVKTEKNIDDIIKDITSKLSEIKFGILGTLDFQEIFAKKGIEYPHQYKLLEVCNPQAAKMALGARLLHARRPMAARRPRPWRGARLKHYLFFFYTFFVLVKVAEM